MKLDRNINSVGHGKYALILNSKVNELCDRAKASGNAQWEADAKTALAAIGHLALMGLVEWGEPGSENEFFVVKLKDKYADDALYRYSLAAAQDGENDYAREVEELAGRAGAASPWCKKPD